MEAIYILILGVAIGAILTAKPDALRNMNPTAFGYTLLGLALFGASLLLEWIGFTCVMVAFVLYHAIGREGWSTAIQGFFSFEWLRKVFRRKPKAEENPMEAEPRAVEPTEEVVDDPIAALDAAQQDEAMQTENAEGARLARDSPLGNVAKQ
jgi:hypothetical protein